MTSPPAPCLVTRQPACAHHSTTTLPPTNHLDTPSRKKIEMAQIKLTYFNLRARAEPARLVLAYAGAKYEDVRLPAPWDNPKPWADLKPNTPYGQCPLLEWDGEVIAQSMAITRFLPNLPLIL